MFTSSLCTSFVALITSAVSVSAVPSLTLKASTPNVDIGGLENLKVTTTITNTGDGTLKLLNDPRGVLSSFPEDSFIIADPTGSGPSFNGARVKYSPTYAAGLNDSRVFTLLDPGASINVIHDLSTAYNFTRSGTGDYSIEPSNLFTYVDADGTPKDLYATLQGSARVKLSSSLAVSHTHEKRINYVGCTSTERTLIHNAAASAQSYASKAYDAIQSISSGTRRYKTWFGTYTSARHSLVQSHFWLISTRDFSSLTYDCTCNDPGKLAYVYPSRFGTIYLCGGFWGAPNTGTDSKAGTLFHECSHFEINGGTYDWKYGQTSCKQLAIDNIDHATHNADSHEYFAENHPAL